MAALDVLAALDVQRTKSEYGRTGRTTFRTDADKFGTAHECLEEQTSEFFKNTNTNAGGTLVHKFLTTKEMKAGDQLTRSLQHR